MELVVDKHDPQNYGSIWKYTTGRNTEGALEFIVHMQLDDGKDRTLCGLNTREGWWEGGGYSPSEVLPSCARCMKSLLKIGFTKLDHTMAPPHRPEPFA